ncbi:hypothetical protein ACFLUR_01975 [Chloroflexota bacterium]
MKRKFTKILGVALPLVMVFALTVALVPAVTPTAEAAAAAARFTNVAIPQIGSAGDYVMTPGSNVGEIAISDDGSVMFATANVTTAAGANISDLLKSTDGGYTWTVQNTFLNAGDIAGIGISPEYATDTTLFVATATTVHQSVDGAKTFSAMDQPTGWAVGTEVIMDMDIAMDSGGRHSVIIGSMTSATTGEVYVYSPATTGMSWEAQEVDGGADGSATKLRQVLAVAFSPNFASDEGVFAVTIGAAATENTTIKSAFGWTRTGGGWGASVGDGPFRDTINGNVEISDATRARIAFPGDFDVDSLSSNIAFVGLTITGADRGDVYKVVFQPTLSSTIDMNVRGLVGTIQTGTNVHSLDVSGDADAANIIVGTEMWSTGVTNYYWLNYYSNDSGTSWMTSRESSATGGTPARDGNNLLISGTGANAKVVMAPDFATSSMAYAATAGIGTSGLSRTTDGGKSWNQVSLVDWGGSTYRVSEMDCISLDKWYMRFESGSTNVTNDSYWLTTTGGSNYERLYSYANPSMPTDFDALDIKGSGKDVFFLTNYALGRFWRSTDAGASFPRTITSKVTPIVSRSIIDETTIYTTHGGGAIWYTENLGRPWVEPEESILSGSIKGITQLGDIHLAKNRTGSPYGGAMTVFVSLDGGKTYLSTLGSNSITYAGLKFDANFAENNYIYGAVAGGNMYRLVFNADDPDSSPWEQIDSTSPGAANVTLALGPTFQFGGVMYAYNYAPVITNDVKGGWWRSTNSDADLDGIYPPLFAIENNGLPTGASVSSLSMVVPKRTFFFKDATSRDVPASYHNQVYMFTDAMSKGVTLSAPADESLDAGVSLSTTDLTMTVSLSWAAVPGATSYQYQVSKDTDFSAIVADTVSTGNQATIGGHITGQTYYWRVRVARAATSTDASYYTAAVVTPTVAAGAIVGAPLISPWSATQSYTIGTPVTSESRVFQITGPEIGATDVSVQPTFVWSGFAGAINYEIMLSEDKDFSIVEWSHTVTDTFYKAEETLAYDTTYYWRVRGVTGPPPTGKGASGPAPGSAWATGIITTQAEMVEETPTVVTVTEPAKAPEVKVVEVPVPQPTPIPSYLLWTIICVGAVLVIALIVLIVRTRRVA